MSLLCSLLRALEGAALYVKQLVAPAEGFCQSSFFLSFLDFFKCKFLVFWGPFFVTNRATPSSVHCIPTCLVPSPVQCRYREVSLAAAVTRQSGASSPPTWLSPMFRLFRRAPGLPAALRTASACSAVSWVVNITTDFWREVTEASREGWWRARSQSLAVGCSIETCI